MDEKRYLVFDSACVACSKTARLIEDESHGWLTARSLGDEEVRRLLAAAGRPDLWAPSILESSGGKARVLTGSRMVLHLVLGIGPVHARRTLRAIRSALREPAAAPVEPAAAGRQVSRRQVLEWSGGALGALMLGPRALRQLSHPVTRPSAGVAVSHITVGDAEQLKQLAGVQAASARFGTLNYSAAQAVRQGGRTSTSIPFLPVQGSPASALVISDYGTGRGYDYFVVSVTGPKDSLAFTVMTVQGAELARLTKSHGTLHGYSADSADAAMAASRASFGAPQGPVPEISWSCFIDCLAGHVSEYCLELCEFCEDPWGCAICAGCAGIWVGVCTWQCFF